MGIRTLGLSAEDTDLSNSQLRILFELSQPSNSARDCGFELCAILACRSEITGTYGTCLQLIDSLAMSHDLSKKAGRSPCQGRGREMLPKRRHIHVHKLQPVRPTPLSEALNLSFQKVCWKQTSRLGLRFEAGTPSDQQLHLHLPCPLPCLYLYPYPCPGRC